MESILVLLLAVLLLAAGAVALIWAAGITAGLLMFFCWLMDESEEAPLQVLLVVSGFGCSLSAVAFLYDAWMLFAFGLSVVLVGALIARHGFEHRSGRTWPAWEDAAAEGEQ